MIELFSGVVALSTLIYALLTWKLVSETRKMREVQTEPKISVSIQQSEEAINCNEMIIQNIGSGPAKNVNFQIDPDFEYMHGRFLSKLNLMNKGLEYLAPNQKIQFFLTDVREDFEKKTKTPFEIKVTYQNIIGKTYERKYIIDLSIFVGLPQLGEPPLYKIAKNIESIQKDVNRLSTGDHRLKAVIYTKSEVEEEEKELMEQLEKRKHEDRGQDKEPLS